MDYVFVEAFFVFNLLDLLAQLLCSGQMDVSFTIQSLLFGYQVCASPRCTSAAETRATGEIPTSFARSGLQPRLLVSQSSFRALSA